MFQLRDVRRARLSRISGVGHVHPSSLKRPNNGAVHRVFVEIPRERHASVRGA
jgi:hypothetical protein